MDETKNTAQTSGEANASAAVGEIAGTDNVSSAGTETASEANFSDNTSADKGSEAKISKGQAAEGEKSAPKGEKSSEYARRRREAEQAKAIKEAEEKAIIRALGGINPFTEEEMKDSHDVAEFLEMQEIKKNGGDPLSDFAKHRKEREREAAAEKAREQDANERMQKDLSELTDAYPDVNIDELVKDEAFNDYADGKLGRKSLKQVYEGYLGFVDRQRRLAENKAAQTLANAKASPGALSSAGESSEKHFTRDEVKAMNAKQIHENYDAIRRSMTKW
ncbi:MAG: hypothetical protein IKB51_03975 [Clostridia bacterium]|nr:hypothetical protein [Clostridia bacterium]